VERVRREERPGRFSWFIPFPVIAECETVTVSSQYVSVPVESISDAIPKSAIDEDKSRQKSRCKRGKGVTVNIV